MFSNHHHHHHPSSNNTGIPKDFIWQLWRLAKWLFSSGGDGSMEPQQPQCRIIQGPVALSAQLVLLVIVLTALAVKRHRERPRRPINIWGLDISKQILCDAVCMDTVQAFSAGAGHLCGMAIAVVANRKSRGASECAWYLCVYLLDCTLGITLAITFHKLTGKLARLYYQRLQASKDEDFEHHWSEALIESGNYGDPPNYRRWAIQVAGWVSCVVSARLTVGGVIILSIPLLSSMLLRLDKRFEGHRDLFLFAVMVGLPMLLNVGQAWIQDQVLKWKHKRVIRRVVEAGGGERERDESVPFLQSISELQNIQVGGNNRNRSSEKISSL